MIRYAEKYAHPGPRPAEEGGPPDLVGAEFKSAYRDWQARAQRMTDWQKRMRQHTVALAVDDAIVACEQNWPVSRGSMARANLVVWLSYLGEPLPPEMFP